LRLDNFLKTGRLIKKRSLTKELCGEGAITVNGSKAKPSKAVKEGDLIVIDLWKKKTEIEVLSLPAGNISRSQARKLYRVLEEQKKSFPVEW
jgi:ribosomal 50S subunit-recycling heat shock protein